MENGEISINKDFCSRPLWILKFWLHNILCVNLWLHHLILLSVPRSWVITVLLVTVRFALLGCKFAMETSIQRLIWQARKTGNKLVLFLCWFITWVTVIFSKVYRALLQIFSLSSLIKLLVIYLCRELNIELSVVKSVKKSMENAVCKPDILKTLPFVLYYLALVAKDLKN